MRLILILCTFSIFGCNEEDCRKANHECDIGFMCIQNQNNEFECILESSINKVAGELTR